MMYCAVPSCSSKVGQSKDVVFHEFPSNMERRERWISTLQALSPQDPEDPWMPSEYTKICSKHFTPGDYIQGPKKRYLAPHAVPSQFQSEAVKSGSARRGRPRKTRQKETSGFVSTAAALRNNDTTTGGDLDQTPPGRSTTNKPVVIRSVRTDDASANQHTMPPVIVELRGEPCDGVSTTARPSGSGGLLPGRRAVAPMALGRPVAPSVACQTQVTGLTISAYEEQIRSLRSECKKLRHELFALRSLAQARPRCRACDDRLADGKAPPD